MTATLAGVDDRRTAWIHRGVTLGVIVLLLLIPQINSEADVLRFNKVITLAIAALGLNLLTGFSGQISVGHGAFYGVGAYTTAILVADHGWPWLTTTIVAAVVAFAVGIVVGLPALRIRGLYLALVTLSLAVLFPQIVKRFDSLTGGTQGKRAGFFRSPGWAEDLGLARDQFLFYLFLAIALVLWLLARNLVRSRTGRALIAIRDDEIAAEVLGVNLSFYKVIIFGISAMLAGIGGSLSVYQVGGVDAGSFEVRLSIEILVAVVIGGVATIVGPAIGAYLIVFVPEWTKEFNTELSPVIFGALLILLMIVMPGGIVGLARLGQAKLRRLWAGRAPPDGDSPGPSDDVTSGGTTPLDGDVVSAREENSGA